MVTALLAQTAMFWQSSSGIIYSLSEEIGLKTLENLQEDLYSFHKSIENSIIKLYNQEQGQLITDLSGDEGQLGEIRNKYSQLAYELAHSAFVPSQNVTTLYIYTASHELIGSYRHAQTPKYSYPQDIYDGADPEESALIHSYIGSGERIMMITSSYNASRDVKLMRYVLKLYSVGLNCAGYVVCDVDPKPILQMIDKYRYTDDQIIWLQRSGDESAIADGMLSGESGDMFAGISSLIKDGVDFELIKLSGGGFELYMNNGQKYNLAVYSLLPRKALELNQRILFRNTWLIVASILVVFTILFALISAGLTKPLTYVVQTVNRIKNGEISLRLKPMRKDEIGVLSLEFNDMLDNTAALMEMEYNARLLANDAKYKALQAQVNPHFLYNTLDTMAGIAASSGTPLVGTLCRALSNIFRYSLNMETPFATLADEILHIKNYMYIMNVRTNNSVELDIQIDSDLLKVKLPRLSIQPLVENSLQHGLKNKHGEKNIIISAVQDGGRLLISVADNGLGMETSVINDELLNPNTDALTQNTSIGLRNINARAKLLYGEGFGVSVDSKIGQGSKVTLEIPFTGVGNDEP